MRKCLPAALSELVEDTLPLQISYPVEEMISTGFKYNPFYWSLVLNSHAKGLATLNFVSRGSPLIELVALSELVEDTLPLQISYSVEEMISTGFKYNPFYWSLVLNSHAKGLATLNFVSRGSPLIELVVLIELVEIM